MLTDPLGLARVEQQVDEPASVLIRPRIPTLTSIFSAHGARDAGAARSRLRRPTGFEIHAVRDYAPGEPLRAVHWPSTARRGRLMVKELDDAPRDDLAIVLDQDPDGVAGPAGQLELRRGRSRGGSARAGARALEPARRPRRHGAGDGAMCGSAPPGHDWEVALDALATVEPVAGARVDRALRSPSRRSRGRARSSSSRDGPTGPSSRCSSSGAAAASVSLVVIASETYAGRPRDPQQPAALRAAAQGVLVAVVTAETADRRGSGRAQRGSGQWLASSAARAAAARGVGAGGCRRVRLGVARERAERAGVRRASRRWRCLPRCRRGCAVRVVVAVVTLGGLTLVAAGRSARGGPGASSTRGCATSTPLRRRSSRRRTPSCTRS